MKEKERKGDRGRKGERDRELPHSYTKSVDVNAQSCRPAL